MVEVLQVLPVLEHVAGITHGRIPGPRPQGRIFLAAGLDSSVVVRNSFGFAPGEDTTVSRNQAANR
ncbi:hypothetical protein PG984_016109 [Apiospora sp. TS-2023a]